MRERASATLTTIVVDDEQLARDELAYQLKDFPEVELIATADNGLEAEELIQKLEPELVFLDIHMPGIDGVGLVQRLRARDLDLPQFVFVTAYEQHAIEAFRLEALDYLLKPVERGRLAESIERARRVVQEKKKTLVSSGATAGAGAAPKLSPAPRSKLLVKANNRNFIVDASEVIYATIDDGLITLVTTNMEGHSNYRTIEDLQANLDREMFWRVHRSYLVNINRIKEVVPWFKSSYQLRMDDRKHTEVPVSRVQTRRLRELFKL